MTDESLAIPAASSSGTAIEPGGEPPRAESGDTSLVPAPTVDATERDRALQALPIDPRDQAKLDKTVEHYVDAISSLDTHGPTFSVKVTEIAELGDSDVHASSNVSNRLLDKSVAALDGRGLADGSAVGTSLRSLRRQLEDLDPSRQGNLMSPRKVLGVLPFGTGNRLREYFEKYRSSQHQIDSIIASLEHGQDELQRDNASIEQEKASLWAVMGRLRQYAYLAGRLDEALQARIAAIERDDADRARVLKEDLLFPVRQKHQDLLTQLAVAMQAYLALDLIRNNNRELIRGVRRATTTTVAALRTAVIVAQAVADQRLVLDQIAALNETTSNLIESTSELLRRQSATIGEQAASTPVQLEKLETAFTNVYATIDEVDAFKVAALESMDRTIATLSAQVEKSRPYLERTAAGSSAASGRPADLG